MNKTPAALPALFVTLVATCSALHAAQPETATSPAVRYILVVRVSTDGAVHRIVDSMLVPSSVPLTLGPPATDGRSLNYAVADNEGKRVFEAGMPNPLVWRSPLPPPGEPEQGHETVVLPQVEYLIRMPYDKAAATLQITVGVKPAFARTTAGLFAAAPPGEQNLNLQAWVRSAEVRADLR